jgi:hypothetical protein
MSQACAEDTPSVPARTSATEGGGRNARAAYEVSQTMSTRRAAPTCQQAEVADADQAFREDVQEEAPEEFVDVERQGANLAPCR